MLSLQNTHNDCVAVTTTTTTTTTTAAAAFLSLLSD
jgi:hypothetical protein